MIPVSEVTYACTSLLLVGDRITVNLKLDMSAFLSPGYVIGGKVAFSLVKNLRDVPEKWSS